MTDEILDEQLESNVPIEKEAEEIAATQIEVQAPVAGTNPIMTIGSNEPAANHNMTMHTASVVSVTSTQKDFSPRIKVIVKYPSSWKKEKFFKDGDVKEVSPETADQFVKLGFATIIEQSKAE